LRQKRVIKESEIGVIPKEWEVIELKNMAKLNKQKYTPIQSKSINYIGVELHNTIENFYKQKAIEKITPLTKKWAKNMGVEPEHISFRYSKNRWGSCSGANRISFNYHLIKLSSSLIEYVVIHELAHITYQNHSKDFWKLVYKHLSDYKVREDKIRIFEKLI